MATQTDVADGVRALLLDKVASKLTDAYQLDYNNIIYRKLQRAMDEAGFLDLRITTEVLNILAAVKILDTGTTPPLPNTFIRPERIEERPNSGGSYTPMSYCRFNLPELAAAATRDCWTWEDNKIKVPAGTAAVDFRVRHTQFFVDLTAAGLIPLPEIQEALIFGSAALIAIGRGSSNFAGSMNDLYENEAKKILKRDSMSELAKLFEFEEEEASA